MTDQLYDKALEWLKAESLSIDDPQYFRDKAKSLIDHLMSTDPTKPTYEELQEGFKAALDAGDRLAEELEAAHESHFIDDYNALMVKYGQLEHELAALREDEPLSLEIREIMAELQEPISSTDPASVECPCTNSGYPVDGMCKECAGHLGEDPGGPRPDDGHYGGGKHCSWCSTPDCGGSGRIPKPVGGETDD